MGPSRAVLQLSSIFGVALCHWNLWPLPAATLGSWGLSGICAWWSWFIWSPLSACARMSCLGTRCASPELLLCLQLPCGALSPVCPVGILLCLIHIPQILSILTQMMLSTSSEPASACPAQPPVPWVGSGFIQW